MNKKFADKDLERLIKEANEHAHEGRLERLRFLLREQDQYHAPFNELALEYFEEARLCWYVGAFVATIFLSQAAFEETFRSYYRMATGVGGNLNERIKVDKASFNDLIKQVENDGLISSKGSASLHKMRKDYRNPYMHVKDYTMNNDLSKMDFFRQTIKIKAPQLLGRGVEEEARETIKILITLLPSISRRLWGIE